MAPPPNNAHPIEAHTVERIHAALNHAVRNRADNPLLHMSRVLRSERHAELAANRERTRLEAEAGEPEEAGPSDQTLRPQSVQELKAILREAAIDMSLWGTENAKAVSHLLGEIRAHESVLRKLGGGGGVRRVVHTVVVEFYFRGRLLVETHHELDGRTRQRFELLSGKVRWHSGEGWQQAARRAIRAALALDITQFTLHEDTVVTEHGVYPSRSFPGLLCDRTRHRVQATLHDPAAEGEQPSVPFVGADRFTTSEPGAGQGGRRQPRQKHHWAWYPPLEWATVQRKRQLEEQRPEVSLPTSAEAELQPCTDVRFDGIGDVTLRDDDLGPAATQLRLLGKLYLGCRTIWYHFIHSGLSRAKILHVQGISAAGTWQDPTICKLSPTELLRAEADAHACFARYIGESVPQRIGEPRFVDEIGGMVLELVGACWRVPELAHTQTHLSNTFAEVCKYDSDHAAELAEATLHDKIRDRPVFGEVRLVTDEVFLGQLNTVVMQSAHREPLESLVEHYGLLPKLARILDSVEASPPESGGGGGGGGSVGGGGGAAGGGAAGGGGGEPDASPPLDEATRVALQALRAALAEDDGDYVGPPGYGGPWFGIVHGDLHGGNIMVDSRSYAWLIDYGEVEDAHVFKDPAKLEACIWYVYTTLPVPPSALVGASPHEVKWWLSVRVEVAEQLVALANAAKDTPARLTMAALPGLLRAACEAAGEVGRRVDVDEVALRFADEAECDEYLVQARQMLELLLPFRALDKPIAYNFVPRFLTKERLRLCWEHVSQIRALLPQSYCRPHATDRHAFDAHPMQYGVALFYFTLKMRFQYREPNPYSRRLAAFALEKLAGYIVRWLQGREVEPSAEAASLALTNRSLARPSRLAYAAGQRLCFIEASEAFWREGVVLRPPSAAQPTHLLRLHVGTDALEREVDLDLHSHTPIPLYAYDAGHPLELLARVGHWKDCVVVNRAPHCNQFVVRMGPTGNQFWTLLLPWNHRSLSFHTYVPLFAVHSYVEANWPSEEGPNEADAIGEGDEGADRLEKREGEELDESASVQVDHGKLVEFVLNFKAAQRGRALPLWCPGLVAAIHKRQFGTALLKKKGYGVMGKTCDLLAGAYRFSDAWGNAQQPVRVRMRRPRDAAEAAAGAGGGAGGGGGADAETTRGPGSERLSERSSTGSDVLGVGGASGVGALPDLVDADGGEGSPRGARSGRGGEGGGGGAEGGDGGDGVDGGDGGDPSRRSLGSEDGGGEGEEAGGGEGIEGAAEESEGQWGPWMRAVANGKSLLVETGGHEAGGIAGGGSSSSGGGSGGSGGGAPGGEAVEWERNMGLDVEVLPLYRYERGAELRLLRGGGVWERFVVDEPPPPPPLSDSAAAADDGGGALLPSPPTGDGDGGAAGFDPGAANTYAGTLNGKEALSVELTRHNHAPVLDPSMEIGVEYLKYAGWIRSTYSFVVDALSGERLDIMLQCVKLRVEGAPGRLASLSAEPSTPLPPPPAAAAGAVGAAQQAQQLLLQQPPPPLPPPPPPPPLGSHRDAFDIVMREVAADTATPSNSASGGGDRAGGRPVLVVGEAASGKSTFARLFLIMCIQQQQQAQLVPFLLTTIDLVRIIKQNNLAGDYLDGYLRSVYGPNSRRYLFLKQAMMERRLVLFLDGMDEVPTGLKSMLEAYIMCYLRTCARVVMTSRPGGFSHAWLGQCVTMKIVPLDATQQENVAKARLKQATHLAMFKELMARPDVQQLASNPLILSMVLSYIRSATTAQAVGPLNRWRLYHSAMSTIITRLDAKTLEARKGQAGRSSDEYMLMLQEIAFKAHCKQLKDINAEVLRAAITEQTSALWDDVKESVARGQFAVLTFFVENDETIYRFGHLTFQEHLCSMVINRMLVDEMERVKAIMTSSGGVKKMLQVLMPLPSPLSFSGASAPPFRCL